MERKYDFTFTNFVNEEAKEKLENIKFKKLYLYRKNRKFKEAFFYAKIKRLLGIKDQDNGYFEKYFKEQNSHK